MRGLFEGHIGCGLRGQIVWRQRQRLLAAPERLLVNGGLHVRGQVSAVRGGAARWRHLGKVGLRGCLGPQTRQVLLRLRGEGGQRDWRWRRWGWGRRPRRHIHILMQTRRIHTDQANRVQVKISGLWRFRLASSKHQKLFISNSGKH